MTWVTVVKFWAYQAHQLQLIVYTNLPLTIPGLELFSLVSKQWGHSDDTIRTFIYPIKMNRLIGVYLTGAYAYGYVFNEKMNQCDFHMRNDEKILTETASRYILVIGV